jgi:hypothetical protein
LCGFLLARGLLRVGLCLRGGLRRLRFARLRFRGDLRRGGRLRRFLGRELCFRSGFALRR